MNKQHSSKQTNKQQINKTNKQNKQTKQTKKIKIK